MLENLLTEQKNIKGIKLLTKMGWKGAGHGLGIAQQGITKPIEVGQILERSGIGYRDTYVEEVKEKDSQSLDTKHKTEDSIDQPAVYKKNTSVVYNNNQNKPNLKRNRLNFRNNIIKLLKNFISSLSDEDLVFEKGLSSEERAIVHKEANRFGLKTRSHGTGENRFLVAQKKRSAGELMESIKKNGGQFSKYELISKGEAK